MLSDEIGRLKGEPAVLLALSAGRTIAQAASAGGVTERTVYRRLEGEAYRAAIRSHRDAAIEEALGRLTRYASAAVDTLDRLSRTADSDSVRRSAARDIVTQVVALHDHVELSTRLAAMEDEVAALKAERDERARRQSAGVTPMPGRTA